jgi:broad specificity phosphatase PhoE
MIYLLRHGKTVWNAEGRFQGQKDSPLTRPGRDQADAVGIRLAQEIGKTGASTKTYVSPLGRTRETAERIARHIAENSIEERRLMELSIGCWDGLTHYEIEMEYPALSTAPTYSIGIFARPTVRRSRRRVNVFGHGFQMSLSRQWPSVMD